MKNAMCRAATTPSSWRRLKAAYIDWCERVTSSAPWKETHDLFSVPRVRQACVLMAVLVSVHSGASD